MNQRHHPHTTSMTAPPPHLYNRYQHDPAMRIATLLGKVWFPLWSTLTKTPVPKEVHRVTTVRIIGREVVAED